MMKSAVCSITLRKLRNEAIPRKQGMINKSFNIIEKHNKKASLQGNRKHEEKEARARSLSYNNKGKNKLELKNTFNRYIFTT